MEQEFKQPIFRSNQDYEIEIEASRSIGLELDPVKNSQSTLNHMIYRSRSEEPFTKQGNRAS